MPDDALVCERPILLVEVLSPSTFRTDRIEKMNAYQELPGLREYALIAQDQPRVEVYRHDHAGEVWHCELVTGLENKVVFESIGMTLQLADLYRRLQFLDRATEGEK